MNLDELQSVQSRERQTDSLQQLRASFYEDAAEFVQGLREQREEAAAKADDPFDSPDVNRLSDDIRTAEQTVEAIYERRVGKVVKMASLAAADMPTEQEGLTKEEQELFETMVTAIEDHRATILDVLGGDAPAGTVSSPPPEGESTSSAEAESDAEGGLDAAAVMGEDGSTADGSDAAASGTDAAEAGSGIEDEGGSDGEADDDESESPPDPGALDPPDAAARQGRPDADAGSLDAGSETDGEATAADAEDGPDSDDTAEPESPDDTDRTTVRITEDVGEIFGVDEREYDLVTDDVVTLPTTNAEPLIDRDAAERIE